MKFLILLFGLLVPLRADQKIYRIMPVGDSITEGGSSLSNWRYPLWEKLHTAGYLVKYVGSQQTPSRIGDLAHDGYGGKDSAFLAATVPANFKKHPADIVWLHAGHNQFADQKPGPRILRDTESLIRDFRSVNPKVTVLLAQPIPSGRLPKYPYLPELGQEFVRLALPARSPTGAYIVTLAILNPTGGNQPGVRFEIQNYWAGGLHPMGRVGVGRDVRSPVVDATTFFSDPMDPSVHYRVLKPTSVSQP